MNQQKIEAKKTSPLGGILLILGILVGLLAASLLSNLLGRLFNTPWTAAAVWLLAIGAAVYVMRDRVMEYRYTVAEGQLLLERLYGLHGKILLNIPLGDVLALDEEKTILARYPDVKQPVMRACLKSCPIPCALLAYRKEGEIGLARIQPNDEMRRLIFDEEKRRQSAAEKWGGV